MMSESYAATNSSSGVLTVTSGGTAVAKINLVGSGYTTSIHLSSAADGSTIITDPVVSGGSIKTSSAPVLAPEQSIDFLQIAFGAHTTLAYSETSNAIGGTLTLANGSQPASIALLGYYMAASFVTAATGHGGTLITEAAQTVNQLLATPHTG